MLLIIVLIIYILIRGLDAYFYRNLGLILQGLGEDGPGLLRSLGFYNQSFFTSRLYRPLLALGFGLLIYLVLVLDKARRKRELGGRIKELEELLIRINQGDYRLEIQEDDEFSLLRDEIVKIITNLKALEEEEKNQKEALKMDLSNIAHQLKTPLTSIGFMVELGREDRENLDTYMERLDQELSRLENFTDLLLKLSRVNSNTIDYSFQELSVRELVEDIVNRLNSQGLRVDYQGEDFNLYGDEVWLYEGFLNIIKNSLEHTRDRLEISFYENPIYKEVRIRDNGPGVEEGELNKIFHRFYRGKTLGQGYGIGLNLSQSIIERHQGEISAYNDQGLVFKIRFYNVT